MKTRYVDDYLDTLEVEFPQVKRKELGKMMNRVTYLLSRYLISGYRGFSLVSGNGLKGKRYKITVSRVFNKRHLKGLRTIERKKRENINGTTR